MARTAIVIGAGPAGLAVGACLSRAGVPAVLLERADQVADSWRRHYDRLHLHTDARHSALPFVPMPEAYPRYVSRDQLVAYLEAYATRFRLDVRLGQDVTSARRIDGGWQVDAAANRYEGTDLVVATGRTRVPFMPDWPGRESYRGEVLHSSGYVNGRRFTGKRVLVVGFGNSGGEIAIDLVECGARPGLAVRSPVNVIPREVLGVPILSIGIAQSRIPAAVADALNAPILRFAIGDVTRYGLRRLPYGPATQITRDRRIPLIDIGTIDLIKSGRIEVHPGVDRLTERGVVFADGSEIEVDAIIAATGYRARVDEFLDEPAATDADGTPLVSGRPSSVPGLHFCGYYVSPTGMLREIGIEARRIAMTIAAQREP